MVNALTNFIDQCMLCGSIYSLGTPELAPASVGAFFVRPTARAALGVGVVFNLMANVTGNSGPGPAQVDLPGSFPGWLSPPRECPFLRAGPPS